MPNHPFLRRPSLTMAVKSGQTECQKPDSGFDRVVEGLFWNKWWKPGPKNPVLIFNVSSEFQPNFSIQKHPVLRCFAH